MQLSKKEQIGIILKRKLATGEPLHSQDVIDVLDVFNKEPDFIVPIKEVQISHGGIFGPYHCGVKLNGLDIEYVSEAQMLKAQSIFHGGVDGGMARMEITLCQ